MIYKISERVMVVTDQETAWPEWRDLGYATGNLEAIREHYHDRRQIELKIEPIKVVNVSGLERKTEALAA